MKHVELPRIDPELLDVIRSVEVNDLDELYEQAAEAAVNIGQLPRDHEMKNDDLAYQFLAWNADNAMFADALGYVGVDSTLIFELGFINCCILEALDER
jgi:arginine/ornithine N-succinyltransferase beta subunit